MTENPLLVFVGGVICMWVLLYVVTGLQMYFNVRNSTKNFAKFKNCLNGTSAQTIYSGGIFRRWTAVFLPESIIVTNYKREYHIKFDRYLTWRKDGFAKELSIVFSIPETNSAFTFVYSTYDSFTESLGKLIKSAKEHEDAMSRIKEYQRRSFQG